MNIVAGISIAILIIVDFVKINKESKRMIYLYISIVLISLLIYLTHRLELVTLSPLEKMITIMKPITDWVDTKLK